ncbi:unnamed protein product [Eruca vesicaria subsp. sativa]|uniref:RING-type E3 ubiquitin transferase n=1 Tax=Eruca vesicaria subsp. sativa TaxID=29727 RepID=A0ABC8INH4_ERUVS|nr:unnamed protein product [Eruca vesicaria subsp. sativa]
MESKKHHRKLLQLITTVQNATSSLPPSSSTPPSRPPWSLDSSMALTIFVLLIALFFMTFFSVFIRHFAEDESTADISFSRPSRRTSSSTMSPRRRFNLRSGLHSQAVRSLPVYRYTKSAKQWIEDCVICLSEFEEGETVKVIPHCGHVFHVDCVDTWLSSHVTCPFCRSSQVLQDQESAESSCRSTAVDDDTCTGMGSCVRRCSSCSSVGQRTRVERSLSL